MKKFSKASIRWLPLDSLTVHPKAQRQFRELHARSLAASFDPDAFGVLLVVEMNGRYLIVDGQHRAWAAREALGEGQTVPCQVFQTLDDAEAARIFLSANKHRPVGALDKFLVRVVAGDPVAIAIVSILKDVGRKVSLCNYDVAAVDACESVYNRTGGPQVFTRTARVLDAAFGGDKDAFSGTLIRGVSLVLGKFNGHIDDGELARRLAKSGSAARLIGQSRELSTLEGTSLPHAAAKRVVNEYNKGKRSGKLEYA